ncbi:hypothetical protein OHC33_007241 [Knufia fluminis]|uniref:Ubiquitin 3 binding protein But2 C-terminal domain-containing protein n=1 Tax=Knufia fluminis TaxID=191047 RepID=A0AAN8EHD2_9EURO|nr:hypothetical protein OHC33_007241 [Knufia fluminis]
MHSFLTVIGSLATLSSITLAAPLKARQDDPQCIDGLKKIFMPEMHNIHIYEDVPEFPSTSTILNVMNGSSSNSVQDQVAVWSNIPSTATQCSLGWAVTEDRSFSVYDNGLIRFFELSGVPPAGTNITAETIAPFMEEGAKNASIDFTFWAEQTGAHTHGGGLVDCKSEMAFYLTKDMVSGGPGSVTLEQNAQNGLFLAIDC